jgi:DNA-directed RNA polymerase subunit RPC12/RpoP
MTLWEWDGLCPECGNRLDTHDTVARCPWCGWKDEA